MRGGRGGGGKGAEDSTPCVLESESQRVCVYALLAKMKEKARRRDPFCCMYVCWLASQPATYLLFSSQTDPGQASWRVLL